MAYDDIIRVADLKTRAQRTERINQEMGTTKDNQIRITEYFHPRAEEVVGLFPKSLGSWFEKSSKRMKRLDKIVNKGRRVRSTSLPAFLTLYILSGLRSYRVKTLRHAIEHDHRKDWINKFKAFVPDQYELAVEIVKCRRLIKGYSDTHAYQNNLLLTFGT